MRGLPCSPAPARGIVRLSLGNGILGRRGGRPGTAGGPHPHPAHGSWLLPGDRGGLGCLQHSQCLCEAAGNQHCFGKHSHIRQKAFTRQSLGCILGSEFNVPAERGTKECTRLFPHKYFVRGDIYRWQKDLIYYHFAFSSLNKNVGWAHT